MLPPRGGGFRGDGGHGGTGGGDYRDKGLHADVIEISTIVQAYESDVVMKLTNEKILYFNAPKYMQNKMQIAKVDEVFGPINESLFSIKMMEGIIATSYFQGDKFYIDCMKLFKN